MLRLCVEFGMTAIASGLSPCTVVSTVHPPPLMLMEYASNAVRMAADGVCSDQVMIYHRLHR